MAFAQCVDKHVRLPEEPLTSYLARVYSGIGIRFCEMNEQLEALNLHNIAKSELAELICAYEKTHPSMRLCVLSQVAKDTTGKACVPVTQAAF